VYFLGFPKFSLILFSGCSSLGHPYSYALGLALCQRRKISRAWFLFRKKLSPLLFTLLTPSKQLQQRPDPESRQQNEPMQWFVFIVGLAFLLGFRDFAILACPFFQEPLPSTALRKDLVESSRSRSQSDTKDRESFNASRETSRSDTTDDGVGYYYDEMVEISPQPVESKLLSLRPEAVKLSFSTLDPSVSFVVLPPALLLTRAPSLLLLPLRVVFSSLVNSLT
jgi:hypothetical protein